MYMRDYTKLYSDTKSSKGIACGYDMGVNEHERLSNITLGHNVK